METLSPDSSPGKIHPAILKAVVIFVALCALSLAFRPAREIPETPILEDSFYGLTVAHNIALGKGIVIEGSTWTNGFQPLFTFLCVPVFLFIKQDKILALRLILALSWLFYLGAAYMVSLIA